MISLGVRRFAPAAATIATVALVVLPIARMLRVVSSASPLQHADYWQLVDRFTTTGGGLDLGGVFSFNNEHPLVIPQLLLWGNIRLFHGSNVALGFAVVLMVVAQLVVLAAVVVRSPISSSQRVALVVLSSVLLFSLVGTWNFSKAMSGAAWITANLFAFAAILLRSRRRDLGSYGLAVLAAASYGTGIVVWPALAAVGVTRPNRRVRQEWPALLGLTITAVWYRLASNATKSDDPDLMAAVKQSAALLGYIVGFDGTAGMSVGAVALLGVPGCVLLAIRHRSGQSAGWAGIATFGWMATLLISLGRHETLQYFGKNRYMSLVAIGWIGLAGLVTTLGHRYSRRSRIVSVGLTMLIVAFAARAATVGGEHADAMLALNEEQERREIVLRLELAEGNDFVGGFGIELPPITDRLRAMEHHPFRDWSLDCDLLGQDLPASTDAADPTAGRITSGEPLAGVPGAVAVDGRIAPALDATCVVLVDDSGTVVGVATTAGDAGVFRGIAPAPETPVRAVAVRADGARSVVLAGQHPPDGAR